MNLKQLNIMRKVIAYLILCLILGITVTSCQSTDDLEDLYIEHSSSEDASSNTGENTGGGGPLNPPPSVN